MLAHFKEGGMANRRMTMRKIRETLRLRHEAGVVRDQMQALELQLRRPADPAVAVPALEGTGLPPGKRDPQPAPFDDVAQAASGEALEADVMVPVDRRIPLHAFVRLCEADHDIGERKAVGWALEEGSVIRSVAHAAMTNPGGGKSQRKSQLPRPAAQIVNET